MVSRQEDATGAQLPVMFPLLAGYFIAIASISNPGNLAVTIGSFVPFTSPVGTLRIPGWIYRYSLLRTGTRVTWTEAWKNRHDPSL